MRTITVQIPETVEMSDRELALLLACTLYEQAKISLGQAAEIAGYSKKAFAEMLGSYDVSIFNYPSTDLAKEVANA